MTELEEALSIVERALELIAYLEGELEAVTIDRDLLRIQLADAHNTMLTTMVKS